MAFGFGDAINAFLGVMGLSSGIVNQAENIRLANENNEINRKNYELGVANFDYQKALQQTIFNREDTALQRRMQDAKNSGLNPYAVIGSGGAGAGSIVSTTAPQQAHNVGANFNGLFDSLNSAMSVMQNIQQTKAQQISNENAKKEGLVLDAKLAEMMNTNKILGLEADQKNITLNDMFINSQRNLAEFNIDFGTNWNYNYDYDTDTGMRHYNFGNGLTDQMPFAYGKDDKSYFNQKYYSDYNSKYYDAFKKKRESEFYDETYQFRKDFEEYKTSIQRKQNEMFYANEAGDLVGNLLKDIFLFK